MRLPVLNSSNDYRQNIDTFLGYNHNLRIADGEWYDMENLTGDNSPVLSPRKERGLYAEDVNCQGMISKDSLWYVDGTSIVRNEEYIDMGLSTEEDMCPKRLVSMGAYLIIMPDKKYINTADTEDRGSIEAEFTSSSSITLSMCRLDGTELTPQYIQPEAPVDPDNMAMWMDTSSTPHSLKQWSQSTGMWVSVVSTYIKVQCAGIGEAFKQYDGVTVSGIGEHELPEGVIALQPQLTALNGSAVLWGCDDDSIILVGILDQAVTIDAEDCQITIKRTMPDMDFIIESSNRLWGCRYGLNAEGAVVNELYSCKLGDFKNWNCFMGISTDSYIVSLGSDGEFTGAVTHGGYPLFFKENCLHKVYGQIPANFQVQTTSCRGVQKGSSDSLAIVNEILYYKSQHAICMYDGSIPQEMSVALGNVQYREAIAAAHGNKYYVIMTDTSNDQRAMFVYDTARGLWMKENDPGIRILCSCRDILYAATEDQIICLTGEGGDLEIMMEWYAETGIINATIPGRAYLKRINIRMQLEPDSDMTVWVQYDSLDRWEQLAYLRGTSLRSFDIPVKVRRCDHLRLKLAGNGNCMIYSMCKVMSQGSDIP